MSKRTYRRFTKEFKVQAVRLAEETDKSVSQVARELGIRVNQIYKWKKELDSKQADAFPGRGKQTGEAAEVSKLKRENERLRQENEILKKAAIYFAKESE